MPKITELYAYVAEDDGPDDEGLMAMEIPGLGMTPLIGADRERMLALAPHAESISRFTRKPYRILRFELVGEVE